jgi:hypothetical protein
MLPVLTLAASIALTRVKVDDGGVGLRRSPESQFGQKLSADVTMETAL